MKIKGITCFFLCAILLTCCTACKKDGNVSTDSSYTSTVTQIQNSSITSKPVSSIAENTNSSFFQSSSKDTSFLSSISSKIDGVSSISSISSNKSSRIESSSKAPSSKVQSSSKAPTSSKPSSSSKKNTSSKPTTTSKVETSSKVDVTSKTETTSTQETSSKTESSKDTQTGNTSSRPKYEADDYLTPEDFDFKSIKQVNYFCVTNIPNSDMVYAVTDIIADTNEEISIGCR